MTLTCQFFNWQEGKTIFLKLITEKGPNLESFKLHAFSNVRVCVKERNLYGQGSMFVRTYTACMHACIKDRACVLVRRKKEWCAYSCWERSKRWLQAIYVERSRPFSLTHTHTHTADSAGWLGWVFLLVLPLGGHCLSALPL